jgi:hypothetical protein
MTSPRTNLRFEGCLIPTFIHDFVVVIIGKLVVVVRLVKTIRAAQQERE